MLINEYLSKKTKISDQSTVINFEKGNKGYTLCVRFGVLLFSFVTLPVRIR